MANGSLEQKRKFYRLWDTWQDLEDDSFIEAAPDYLQAVGSAPSTYVAAVTGGGYDFPTI